MSVHISAKQGEIAKHVLMPGDPLRARYIADNFLSSVVQVSTTRNVFFFTGEYKGKLVTVGASGMGCPSIGIYSYELFTEYEVDSIMRIGTCGAYTADLNLYDLINVDIAASESTFAKYAWGIEGDTILHQGNIYDLVNQAAENSGKKITTCTVHSSDIFYRKDLSLPAIAKKHGCLAVEMEAFALFANAQHLGKNAAALLTVSDVIPTHQQISADEREKALGPMIELALETTLMM